MSTLAPTAPDRRWLVLVLVCIAQFMVVLDATVVNVALPSIQADLGFSVSSLQWVVNAYTLAFGGFLLLGGRAADYVGPGASSCWGSWSSRPHPCSAGWPPRRSS